MGIEEEIAKRLGMDVLDVAMQEQFTISKHMRECKECSNLLNSITATVLKHINKELI